MDIALLQLVAIGIIFGLVHYFILQRLPQTINTFVFLSAVTVVNSYLDNTHWPFKAFGGFAIITIAFIVSFAVEFFLQKCFKEVSESVGSCFDKE